MTTRYPLMRPWLSLAILSGLLLGFLPGAALGHGDEEGLLAEPLVRIGLAENQAEATLSVRGGSASVIDPASGNTLATIRAGENLTFRPDGGRVRAGKSSGTTLRLVPTPGSQIIFRGVPWRGDFELAPWEGKLYVINRCRLDEYLYGVVPGEMPSNWHPEALKSQAVAARTYAVQRLGQYASSHGLYDLRSDIFDQVYLGMREENAATNRAIDATSGLILTYDGEPIVAYYHSQSGEATINGTAMRGEKTNYPYLRGVPSRETGFKRWTIESNPADLRQKLQTKGKLKLGEITAFGPHPEDSGLLVVRHTDGILELPRNYLRTYFGYQTFLSPNFIIEIDPLPQDDGKPLPPKTKIRFLGSGWGHGVGMSQTGAYGYAKDGWTYRQILAHYYHGTELSIWFDISGGASAHDLFALDQ